MRVESILKNSLLKGKPYFTILDQALPVALGLFAFFTFNIVDTFYIGKLGTQELAAMGFLFPITFLVMSFIVGLGIGVSAAIAKQVGRGNFTEVHILTTHAYLLSLVVTVVISLVGLFTLTPLFTALGASPLIISLIKQYLVPYYLASFLIVIPLISNSVFRAIGDAYTPGKILITGGILNIIIDPLLIFGIGPFPRLEMFGGILASIIAWFGGFLMYCIAVRKEHLLLIKKYTLREIMKSWNSILHVGLPAAISTMLFPLAQIILTALFSPFGPAAVAAFGVSNRLEAILYIAIISTETALLHFVGQNHAAKEYGRTKKAISFCFVFGLVTSFLLYIVLLFTRVQIAGLFSTDPVVQSYIIDYILYVPLTYGVVSLSMYVNAVLNALHKPIQATATIVFRFFVCRIPFALLFSTFYGVQGLFIGLALANLFSSQVVFFFGKRSIANSLKE